MIRMYKKLRLVLIITLTHLLISSSFAQAPEKMSYQAVIRNASGTLVKSSQVGIKISILQTTSDGTVVYAETHIATTNSDGLVKLEIGGGTPVTGTFGGIDWSADTYFIKTETDPAGGTNYTMTGTSQILSVPYALYAKTAGEYTETDPNAVLLTGNQTIDGNKTFTGTTTVPEPVNTTDAVTKAYVDATDTVTKAYVDATFLTDEIQDLSDVLSKGNDAEGKSIINVSELGIGTTTPELSLTLDVNGGILAKGIENAGDTLTSTGYGTRLIWYPRKSAFRAGFAGSTEWDDDSIGVGSTALGYQPKATGHSSVAMGYTTAATGDYSTAMGASTTASAVFSTAMGSQTTASGWFSTALGDSTTASGFSSTALGDRTKASGYYSIAMGQGIEAGGNYSVAIALDDLRGTVVQQHNTMSIMGGKVGIGTTTPDELLEVAGKIRASGGMDAGNNIISNVADPTDAQDAATKAYVDKIRTMILTQAAGGKVSDIDDNSYNTIKIGDQVWMAENLKTTKYSNGDLIGTTDPYNLDISGETDPKYQWAFNGDESNIADYGRLYTWYAVTDGRNICPAGWHVPTDADWTILTDYLGGLSVAGGKLKDIGTVHWSSPNNGATNESCFTALPGGVREDDGTFGNFGTYGYWWSATEYDATTVMVRLITNEYDDVTLYNYKKKSGFSVRCLKD